MVKAVGIDFGTTNSVVALLHDDGSVITQRHASLDVFRSLLCSGPSRALAAPSSTTRQDRRRSRPIWKIRWTAG